MREKFKIVDANAKEGPTFSITTSVVTQTPSGYGYLIAIQPQVEDTDLEDLVTKEVAHILHNDGTWNETWRGCSSLVATATMWYFGCGLFQTLFGAGVADSAAGYGGKVYREHRAALFAQEPHLQKKAQ